MDDRNIIKDIDAKTTVTLYLILVLFFMFVIGRIVDQQRDREVIKLLKEIKNGTANSTITR